MWGSVGIDVGRGGGKRVEVWREGRGVGKCGVRWGKVCCDVGRDKKRYGKGCGEVRWGVGKVRGDVGREVGKCVGV